MKNILFESGERMDNKLYNKGIKTISIDNSLVITEGYPLLSDELKGFKKNRYVLADIREGFKGVEINSFENMYHLLVRQNNKPNTTYKYLKNKVDEILFNTFNFNLSDLNGIDGIYQLVAVENKLN